MQASEVASISPCWWNLYRPAPVNPSASPIFLGVISFDPSISTSRRRSIVYSARWLRWAVVGSFWWYRLYLPISRNPFAPPVFLEVMSTNPSISTPRGRSIVYSTRWLRWTITDVIFLPMARNPFTLAVFQSIITCNCCTPPPESRRLITAQWQVIWTGGGARYCSGGGTLTSAGCHFFKGHVNFFSKNILFIRIF